MVVPAEVVAVHGDTTCDAYLSGYRVRMRCSPAQRAGWGSACLRASAVRIAAGGETGVPARVTGTMYQGGYFRVDAIVAAQPDVALHFTLAEPTSVVAGADIHVAVEDGWIIPGPGSS